MEEISTNLKNAAATATSDGSTAEATQLTTLASDFSAASSTGDLPNIQDLANALGGTNGAPPPPPPSTGTNTDSTTSSANSTDSLSSSLTAKILAAFQIGNSSQSGALDPMSVIVQTLSTAGVFASNS